MAVLTATLAPFLLHRFIDRYSAQIQTFVTGLAELNQDPVKFKLNLRDFLIELREFSGDNAELYLEEQEARKAEERQKALTVPGMVKPSEVVDADEEL